MVKDYANTLILAIIAVLLLISVVRLDSIVQAARATDEDVLSVQDHISFIRAYVCVEANPDLEPEALFAECWAHQGPDAVNTP